MPPVPRTRLHLLRYHPRQVPLIPHPPETILARTVYIPKLDERKGWMIRQEMSWQKIHTSWRKQSREL